MIRRSETRPTPPAPLRRCAIYTRKSTDEGLEQSFNSLDAQRESAEAFVHSQAAEGWTVLQERYDDGGYSGGNLERPALQRLMTDIEAGKVDCVVVYKVDRLSRSLLDFARLMDVFERRGIAFVSVTQQLHTGTSLGRLMLHVLLSFAQFERELIAERTRDKMAAARRKGKWTGGVPRLGYRLDASRQQLIVDEDEAAQVRAIFELYRRWPSLGHTVRELQQRGWRTKCYSTKQGRIVGDKVFTKSSLRGLLTSALYVGQVEYAGQFYPGEQPAIVDPQIWQEVQALLAENGRTRGTAVPVLEKIKLGSTRRVKLCCRVARWPRLSRTQKTNGPRSTCT